MSPVSARKTLKIAISEACSTPLTLNELHDELSRRGFSVDFDSQDSPSALLSSLVSELSSPLTSLVLHAHLKRRLLEREAAASLSQRKLREVVDAEERKLRKIIRLVNEIASLVESRRHEPPAGIEKLDLCHSIRRACELAAGRIATSGSRVITRLDEPLPGWWDRRRIEQACFCLLVGLAREFPARDIEVNSRHDGKWAKLLFASGGPGREAPKPGVGPPLPGPPDRDKQEIEGLHALASAIQFHGGTLVVTKPPEGAVVVTVLLPVRLEQAE